MENKNIFVVADLDNTLFDRKDQLEDNEMLRLNRGKAGTEYIVNTIGIKNYLDKYYEGKPFPKNIINEVRNNTGLILTAGNTELQHGKVKYMNLTDIPVLVVEEASQKPEALIDYFKNQVRKIFDEIHIYEDRPNYFIDEKNKIEKALATKVRIFQVYMKGNDKEPNIKEVGCFNEDEFNDLSA